MEVAVVAVADEEADAVVVAAAVVSVAEELAEVSAEAEEADSAAVEVAVVSGGEENVYNNHIDKKLYFGYVSSVGYGIQIENCLIGRK